MPSHVSYSSSDGPDQEGNPNQTAMFPSINRHGSVASQSGTDSGCPSDYSLTRSHSVSTAVSNSTNRDSVLRLPNIDRSKTNSICSYASSNISSVTTSSSHLQTPKVPHIHNGYLNHSQDFHDYDKEDMDSIGSVTPQFDHSGMLQNGIARHKRKNMRIENRAGRGDIKLPDIFSCKSSSIGSPVHSPSPTLRHQGRLNKKTSVSLQDLAGQLRREESILGDNRRSLNRSPNTCLTIDSQGFHRNDNSSCVTVRSSLPTPVLFPMRDTDSRMSRKSRSSVKRNKDKNRRDNDNMLKENEFKDVIEKLEAFSNVENSCEDKNSLVLGKTNSLQKVREETEIDQYIYTNGYDHPAKTRKGQKRAQSEDRRSAKVH